MEEHLLMRAGCTLHYWLGGPEGRPLVVLTHGANIDHEEFELQLPVLVDKYRVLAWDMRGHGLSRPAQPGFSVAASVEDLAALLDATGYKRATLVGHSLGGNIGQEFVFRYPGRVQALVMLGCTCNTLRLTWLEKLSLDLAPAMFRLYPWDLLKRQSAQISSIRPDVQQWLYEKFGQTSKEEFATVMIEAMRCLHYEPGYRITHPLLLSHGATDRTGNIRKIAPAWAAREPDCRYVVIPEAGHMANMDNAEFFNRLLVEFLAAHGSSETQPEAHRRGAE